MSNAYPPPPPFPSHGGVPSPGFASERTPPPTGLVVALVALVAALDLVQPFVFWFDFKDIADAHLPDAVYIALTVLPLLVLIGVVAVVARTTQRCFASIGLVVAALVVTGIAIAANHYVTSIDQFRVAFGIRASVVGVLVVAAWQVARRGGSRWAPALAVVPVLVLLQLLADDPINEVLTTLTGGLSGDLGFLVSQVFSWALGAAPIFIAVFLGAALDRHTAPAAPSPWTTTGPPR